MLELEHGVGVEQVVLALAAPLVLAAHGQLAVGLLGGPVGDRPRAWRIGAPRAGQLVEADATEARLTVPVKNSSTRSWDSPMASKIWAPV